MEKLSWEDTARAMAASGEDWSAWETTDEDGINELPWQVEKKHRVAEPQAQYPAQSPPRKRR